VTQAPDPITFTGKQIILRSDNSLLVNQADYIDSIETHRVPPNKRQNPELIGSEISDYSSATGSLQWVSTNSRPDVSAPTSLLQQSKPTLQDLREVYKVITHLKNTKNIGIVIVPLDLSQIIVVCFHDASWANASGFKSQIGMLIFLCTPDVFEHATAASLAYWKSNRAKRVARSTLSAETQSADSAIDHGFYVACMLSEVLTGQRTDLDNNTIPIYSVTDCKSLYDAVRQATPSLEEKRTAIDLVSIRASIPRENFRWVPTTMQQADAMTKYDGKLMASFAAFLSDPKLVLVDTD
jgi:hypothetical protein